VGWVAERPEGPIVWQRPTSSPLRLVYTQGMDESEVTEEPARSTGGDSAEKAKEVLDALKKARVALAPPPDAGRTGFFPSFRRHST